MGMHVCDKHKKKWKQGLKTKTNCRPSHRRNFNSKITVAISSVLVTNYGFEQLFFFNEEIITSKVLLQETPVSPPLSDHISLLLSQDNHYPECDVCLWISLCFYPCMIYSVVFPCSLNFIPTVSFHTYLSATRFSLDVSFWAVSVLRSTIPAPSVRGKSSPDRLIHSAPHRLIQTFCLLQCLAKRYSWSWLLVHGCKFF